jgi:hypothetical protein
VRPLLSLAGITVSVDGKANREIQFLHHSLLRAPVRVVGGVLRSSRSVSSHARFDFLWTRDLGLFGSSFRRQDYPAASPTRSGLAVLANIHMFKLAFAPESQLQPQIVRYRTGLKSDFEKFLLANSITLTPGTVTIKILGDTFYIHAISDFAAGGLDGEMERRIAHIFAMSDEPSPVSHPVES